MVKKDTLFIINQQAYKICIKANNKKTKKEKC